MNEFQNEKDTLKGLDIAKSVEKRSKEKICDWADEQDRRIMKADERFEQRSKELDIIVPTRICPSCQRRIYFDSSWVIDGKLAWCRSCFHGQHKEKSGDGVSGSIIKKVLIRVEFDGWGIKVLRGRAGIGMYAFAMRCGWTKAYQYNIEKDIMKTLSWGSITKIIQVFEDLGVVITDSI